MKSAYFGSCVFQLEISRKSIFGDVKLPQEMRKGTSPPLSPYLFVFLCCLIRLLTRPLIQSEFFYHYRHINVILKKVMG